MDWQRIWEHVAREFACDIDAVHGPSHRRRVERIGLRLFAVLHDSRREHEGWDNTHGARGAACAASLRGVLLDLSDEHFGLLHHACIWRTHGRLSDEPTIETCWDADRLDLRRVGTRPGARFMSTEAGPALVARAERNRQRCERT
jgi:uncharacterized protein